MVVVVVVLMMMTIADHGSTDNIIIPLGNRERQAREAIQEKANRQASLAHDDQLVDEENKAKYVALDCEMVG